MSWRKLLALGALGAALVGGCRPPVEPGVFSSVAEWEMPPAYHGNYFAPGGNLQDGAYVYEPLFIYLPRSGTYLPRLAESYQESPDHLTLTVHLKKGVVWQDGTPFTSRDVEVTTYLSWLTGQDVHTLKTVQCPDDDTVVFHFSAASPAVTVRMLTRWITASQARFGTWAEEAKQLFPTAVALQPGDVKGQIALNERLRGIREQVFRYHPTVPVGTGPYQVVRVSASDVMLDRFPRYHDVDKVHIEHVHLQRAGDNSVLWSFLIAGDLDAATPATPYDVVQEILARNPQTHLNTPSDMSDFGIVFNCADGPTKDAVLRRAIARVIARDQVRQVAYYYGDTSDPYSLCMPMRFRHAWLGRDVPSDWPRYTTDTGAAEKLLQDAGYRRDAGGHWQDPQGHPLSFEISSPAGNTDEVLLAESVASQLSHFGIPTDVRTQQVEQYAQALENRSFTLASVVGVSLGAIAKPSVAFDRFFGKGGEIETAAGLDPHQTVDGQAVDTEALALQLDTLPDGAAQQSVVRTLAHVADEQCFYVPCYEKNLMIFTVDGRRVTGWPDSKAEIWEAAPGGVDLLYATLLSNGTLRSVR